MTETPQDFVRHARQLIRGYTPTGAFTEACALIIGYDVGRGRGLLDGFQQWLGQSPGGRSELLFWYHVLAEALPSREHRIESLSPGEDDRAVQVLFELLEAHLAGVDPLKFDLSE